MTNIVCAALLCVVGFGNKLIEFDSEVISDPAIYHLENLSNFVKLVKEAIFEST